MPDQGIPSELLEIYDPLFNQVCHLHSKWEIFCQLFASEKEVLELLNRSAGGFFRIVQDVLAHDVLLNLSRLTDPDQTRQQDNLSLYRLGRTIDERNFPDLKTEIELHLTNAKSKCQFARNLRNKLIALTMT